jgi:hypothetical protein
VTLLVVTILLTSELPDPGRMGTITLAGGLGAFVGAMIAYARRQSSQVASDMTRIGMLVGVGAGLVGWFVVFAIDRL